MATILTKLTNVFQDYWLADLTRLSRDTENHKFPGHMGLLSPRQGSQISSPRPDAPSFQDQGFLPITVVHFKDSHGLCPFQRQITKDEVSEILHTQQMKTIGGCDEECQRLTQVQAGGTCPAKICFKVLEETSAASSVQGHVR